MTNITPSVALIVGGSSGMGLDTARRLAASGVKTFIVGKSVEKLSNAKAEIKGVETLQANLYQKNDVQRIIDFASNGSTPIKYLVNAAGYFKPTPFLEHTEQDYDQYLDLNRAIFFITQAVAKNMAKNGGGSIVNIGSMWAQQAIKATLR